MPRTPREHEDHLENVEPVGVVILNDLSYLLQDVSEVVLDLAKLLKNRRPDVLAFIEKAKEGPEAISELLPEEFLPFLMGSAGEVAGVAMETKSEVEPDEEEGEEPSGGFSIDIEKLMPEMLEKFGNLIREKATGLEELVEGFEARLLEENPPA